MQENAVAIYNKGYCYYTGSEGYPLDYRKAMECFKQAAELGYSDAMNYLGIIYERGQIVPRDNTVAANWFYKALQANSSNPYPAYNLGRMYYNGLGVEQNKAKAYQYCKIAVDLGKQKKHSVYAGSCYLCGCILLELYKNYREAYPYFWEAADCGNMPEAWYNLGWLAEQGAVPVDDPGVDKNTARDSLAKMFYGKAAELNYPAAMDALGRLYVKYNMMKEAKYWITKAASTGYEPAKKRLKLLNFSQSGSVWDLFK